MGIKARTTRTIGFSAATVEDLATAINAWIADTSTAGAGEKELISIHYQFDGANCTALVLYAQ